MAKEYKKRQRASKYDQKVSIDASFEDVIKIALGMEPQQLSETKTFTFSKGTAREEKILRENYSLDIPDKLTSDLAVKIKLVTGESHLMLTIWAEKEQPPDGFGNIGHYRRAVSFQIDVRTISLFKGEGGIITFPKDKHDFICNKILIDCHPKDMDATLTASVHEEKPT